MTRPVAATSSLDRPLPWSQQAEQATLGACMLDPAAFARAAGIVDGGHFYDTANGVVWDGLAALDRNRAPIDRVTLEAHLVATGAADVFKFREGGLRAYLEALVEAVITTDNVTHYARIVRGKATLRKLAEAGETIAAGARADVGDLEEFVDKSERLVFEAAQNARRAGQGGEKVDRILGRAIRAIEKRYDRKQLVTGVPSGYPRLDAMTAGFQPSDLIVIAARPSMGKTALVMNAVQRAAIEYGVPALVFSLEMSKESLVERLICSEASVDSTRLRSGMLEQRDWIAVTKAAARIADAPITIDDAASPSLAYLRAEARRWRGNRDVFKAPDAFGVVVIDYLQLIAAKSSRGEQNREREIAEISRGLKALAKELRVPVIVLAQLNRKLEERGDKRPMMSDLRESGAIEQDADVIAFIYRDEVYNRESPDAGTAEIIVGKQRTGPTGTVRLKFLSEYTRFEHMEYSDDDRPAPPKGKKSRGGFIRDPEEP